MRVRTAMAVLTVLALVTPAAASANFVHVVAPGESLTSVAAADGLSVQQLAAANGLSSAAQLVAGTGLQIPPQSGAVSSVASGAGQAVASGAGQAVSMGDGDNDGDDVTAAGDTASATPVSSSVATGGGGSYVVQPGDTLSGIAARAGVSVAQLAAANGLNPNGVLLAGSVLQQTAAAPVNSATAQVQGGSYVVQPGDTLTAIAARAGVSVAQLAAQNGLDPNGVLLAGSALSLSGSGTMFVSNTQSTGSAATQPVGAAAEGSAVNPPYPTPEMLSAGQIGSIAQSNGVSASLADAIAWQESGFNNDLVSSADARGIMQILPGTWQWIQSDLNAAGPPLAPASANDNVRGGVLMLRSLLDSTGGDPAMAAAGYYQGLPSVQQNGVYPSTQQYVNSVMALRQQFGGG